MLHGPQTTPRLKAERSFHFGSRVAFLADRFSACFDDGEMVEHVTEVFL